MSTSGHIKATIANLSMGETSWSLLECVKENLIESTHSAIYQHCIFKSHHFQT